MNVLAIIHMSAVMSWLLTDASASDKPTGMVTLSPSLNTDVDSVWCIEKYLEEYLMLDDSSLSWLPYRDLLLPYRDHQPRLATAI